MRKAVSFALSVILAILAFSCTNPTMGNETGSGSENVSSLKFNLSGAKAVGAADIAASKRIKGLQDIEAIRSAITSKAMTADEYGLVRIMEDGSVELAMSVPEGVWLPKVMFIAKSPVPGARDLYVAFENSIQYWDEANRQEVNLGSFLHILEDGTYHKVIDKVNGRVKNYSWYGNDNYKPVSFDSYGRMYYVFETWGSTTSSNQIFVYDPTTFTSTPLTAALSGYSYNNFEVSPDGTKLFVQGMRQVGSAQTNFFRMYPVNDVEHPVTVYYSSNSSTWVRGYKVSPAGVANQNVILNGYNIRGINGLLRANIVSDSSITYDPLFDSSNNNGNYFSPDYNEWYSEWEAKTYFNGFFDRFNVNDIYLVMTDKSDFFYLRLSDFINWNGYTSISVAKNPTASDWYSQGWMSKTIGNGTFGFASSTTDKTKIIVSTVNSGVGALYDAVKANVKALTFVHRWNIGIDTVVSQECGTALVDSIRANYLTSPMDYSTLYRWNNHWYIDNDSTKGLNWTAIMAYAGKYFMEEVAFKYGSNAAGSASQAAFEAYNGGVYKQSEIWGNTGSATYFLDAYFVKATDNVTLAQTFQKYKETNNLSWLNFQNVSSLFYDDSNSCWAVIGGTMWGGSSSTMHPVKILDGSGNKLLQFIPALETTYHPVSFLSSGNYLFFRDGLLDFSGYESGYHKLYSIDLASPLSPPRDLLMNVADNGEFEIVDFSVSGNELYFTGVKGTGVIGGKIDLATLAYTALDSDYLLRNIQAY